MRGCLSWVLVVAGLLLFARAFSEGRGGELVLPVAAGLLLAIVWRYRRLGAPDRL